MANAIAYIPFVGWAAAAAEMWRKHGTTRKECPDCHGDGYVISSI